MNKRIPSLALLALLAVVLTILPACAPQNTPAALPKVRVAALPIIDTLPLYVAQEKGYFKAEGIEVEFVPAASAAERDQLLAAGQADTVVNDLVAVTLFNRDQTRLTVVRVMRSSGPNMPLYRVLAAPGSSLKGPKDLAGQPIGISEGSVIQFMTEQMLVAGGLDASQITTQAVPKISDRLQLLLGGKIPAATLPEPFSTYAVQLGAVVLADDTGMPGLGSSVISFRSAFAAQYPDAVKRYLKAVERAVADINAHPDAFRDILGKYQLVPTDMLAGYPVPTFPTAGVPDEATFKKVVDWAMAHKLLTASQDYAQCVTGQYLPAQ
jgi:NitT/TauT family transport system substrate-binding protein